MISMAVKPVMCKLMYKLMYLVVDVLQNDVGQIPMQ